MQEVQNKKSYFDGGVMVYIGYSIAIGFLSMITLGLAAPWLTCWYQKWLCEHTYINGRRLKFDGTGGELFLKMLWWGLLTCITCGIYMFWAIVNQQKWVAEHTHFAEGDGCVPVSEFKGTGLEFLGYFFLSFFACLIPVVGVVLSTHIIIKWVINNTVIDSHQLKFTGDFGGLFVKHLIWGLLSMVTCGIYGLFVPVKYIEWETEHTVY